MITCSYGNDRIIFVVPNKTRSPGIKIIITNSYIFNGEIAVSIGYTPELVTLLMIKISKVKNFSDMDELYKEKPWIQFARSLYLQVGLILHKPHWLLYNHCPYTYTVHVISKLNNLTLNY